MNNSVFSLTSALCSVTYPFGTGGGLQRVTQRRDQPVSAPCALVPPGHSRCRPRRSGRKQETAFAGRDLTTPQSDTIWAVACDLYLHIFCRFPRLPQPEVMCPSATPFFVLTRVGMDSHWFATSTLSVI